MIGCLGLVTFLPNFHKFFTKLYHPCFYLTKVPMTLKSTKELHCTTKLMKGAKCTCALLLRRAVLNTHTKKVFSTQVSQKRPQALHFTISPLVPSPVCL